MKFHYILISAKEQRITRQDLLIEQWDGERVSADNICISYSPGIVSRMNSTRPMSRAVAMAMGTTVFRTSPSFTHLPVVVVPKTILPGQMALPTAPPAVCAPAKAQISRPNIPAVVVWKTPNIMFEDILLLVTNEPSRPMAGTRRA